jgi:hypothetical protein
MIVAIKRSEAGGRDNAKSVNDLMEFYGLSEQRLEKLLQNQSRTAGNRD